MTSKSAANGPGDARFEVATTAVTFVAVVPVKPPARGKSRLGAPAGRRRELAGAFALDTVAAVRATPEIAHVLVATDDAAFSRDLGALGCLSVPDGTTGDLNAALHQAVAEARRRWPDLQPIAICADLPALRPDDLTSALLHAPDGAAAFVADAPGTGTTLYTAPYDAFAPRFGAGSRAAHLASGAHEITGRMASLRCDVDDLDDLRAALAIGVGPATSRVTARWELHED